ncbi:LysR family transcriptional regulator [Qipengyuania sp. MTN3-11]|uniref:LysR family transcriptional regulator n=1 Tax=Qipengyuania sp. MTN3-11 TaxID=3056557 RepID=UPI0036F1A1ED
MDPFSLNLRHIRALSEIVTRGSVSAAAESVHLSQPALTQGIAKMERQLGLRLFERGTKGMEPTPEGLLLAERAAAAIRHLRGGGRGARGMAHPEQLLTATQLRAFVALVDNGSFAAAAQATGQSQPALHRAVRDLEQLFALPLVERRGRTVALTGAGQKLARAARLAASELTAGIAETHPEEDRRGGRIIVGAMPLCRALVLPRAISRFVRAWPRAKIDVIEGSWRELVDPLRDGEIDLMIGALRDDDPPDLVQSPLMIDRLAVIGRANHPLTGRAPALPDLARYPWIVGNAGSPLRAHWETLFDEGVAPDAPIECGSVMVIRSVLAESDFLTLLSVDQVALELDAGMLGIIAGPLERVVRTIGISRRASWRPTRAQSELIALVEEVARETRISENQ